MGQPDRGKGCRKRCNQSTPIQPRRSQWLVNHPQLPLTPPEQNAPPVVENASAVETVAEETTASFLALESSSLDGESLEPTDSRFTRRSSGLTYLDTTNEYCIDYLNDYLAVIYYQSNYFGDELYNIMLNVRFRFSNLHVYYSHIVLNVRISNFYYLFSNTLLDVNVSNCINSVYLDDFDNDDISVSEDDCIEIEDVEIFVSDVSDESDESDAFNESYAFDESDASDESDTFDESDSSDSAYNSP